MNDVVVGIDIGSTSIKMLVATPEGREKLVVSRRTPWDNLDHGQAEMPAGRVLDVIVALAAEADAALRRDGTYRVHALAVSGMAEAGVVLDQNGLPTAPIFAWFDPRGGEQILRTPAEFRNEFLGRTGLPVGPLATISKLLYLRDQGVALESCTFVNVPEFVIHSLGGPRVAEYSLVSRTGMIDQDDSQPWGAALDVLNVGESILAERVGAGDPVGQLSDDRLPSAFQGATLTVAGHDHLVSAVAAGATTRDELYDSMGTAEALVRVLDTTLPFDARERLATAGINTVRHVLPGKYVLLAGTKSGLLMRRVLQLLGITDAHGRREIDERVMALPVSGMLTDGGLEVSGARNNDGVLRIVANSDGLSPEELFIAALTHGNAMCAELLEIMNREYAAATSTLLTGGWSKMRSVVRAREQVFPRVSVSTHDEGTAFGAALFASFAAARNSEFEHFAAAFLAEHARADTTTLTPEQ